MKRMSPTKRKRTAVIMKMKTRMRTMRTTTMVKARTTERRMKTRKTKTRKMKEMIPMIQMAMKIADKIRQT